MDTIILETQDVVEVSSEWADHEFRELSDLHLALVGGGGADVSPF